jgi:hypothetical protein
VLAVWWTARQFDGALLLGGRLLFALALGGCGGRSSALHKPSQSEQGTGGSQTEQGTGGTQMEQGAGGMQTEQGTGGTRTQSRMPPPDAGTLHCAFQGFAPAAVYGVANEPGAILAIDRTHDGHLDLVVSESVPGGGWTSELFVNQGDGGFVETASYGADANNVSNMVAGDFDGDGRLDLASQSNAGIDVDTTDHTTGLLGIDFGVAGGMFAPALATLPTPRTDGALAVADFNADGRPDLAFPSDDYVIAGGGVNDAGLVAIPGPEDTELALSVFMNRGDGTFAAPTTYANLDAPRAGWFGVGDFDGDGHIDFAERATRNSGGFGVFFNAGDGSLGDEVTFHANEMWGLGGLGVADFDGDGIDDVALTTILDPNLPDEANVIEIFTGTRNRTFNGPAVYPLPALPDVDAILTGDFNGDAHPDLALVLRNTWGSADPIPIAVFQNLGDGTFGPPVNYDVGGQAFQYVIGIAAGDFNGDGVTDLAVTTSGEEANPDPESVSVLLSECAP